MSTRVKNQQSSGFTLVEMLVVAPLLVLTIAVIIGFLLSLVGSSIAANSRTQTIYDVQTALNQIEQDAVVGTQFMSSYTPHSPQGKDDGTAPFQTSAGDIIINQYATTSDPQDSSRAIVFYANQPQACTGQYQINQPFFIKSIYFLKTEANGTKSLYRRMIVPLNNTSSNNGDTTCGTPWQRSSCTTQNLSDPRCQAKDIRLLTNVTSISTTYYNAANPSTVVSDPTQADSLRVTVSVNNGAAGTSITQTSSVAATRTNSATPTPQLPTTPTISIYSPTSQNYNNPLQTSFQWSSSYASQYTYTYKVDKPSQAGTWSTPVTSTNTILIVPTTQSNVTITLQVTASNDSGNSATAQYIYATPLWTPCALQNSWVNYGSSYASAGYSVTAAGLLTMQGLIKNGQGGVPVCTLPSGIRPATGVINASIANNGSRDVDTRIDVNTDGTVVASTAPTGAPFLSLDSVKFMLPTASIIWNSVSSWNYGWHNFGSPWQTLRYGLDTSGRVQLSGVIAPGSLNCPTGCADGNIITTLPAGYQPSEYIHIPVFADANGSDSGYVSWYDAIGINGTGAVYSKGFAAYSYKAIQVMFYPAGTYPGGAVWNNLTFGTNWGQYSGFAAAQYIKGSDGMVTVKGLVQNSTCVSSACTPPSVIGTLPAGYRPASTHTYIVHDNTAWGRVDVQSNGSIVIVSPSVVTSGGFLSLDGIHFMAEQ